MGTMDNTYAERFPDPNVGRTSSKIYATDFDDSVADAVVDGLTTDADYLEALTDKFKDDAEYIAGVIAGLVADDSYPEKLADYLSTDAEYLAGIIAALVADDTYAEKLADYLSTDAEYLAGVVGAIDTELVEYYALAVTGEQPVPDVAYDADPVGGAASHTFDPPAFLGGGIVPSSVTFSFLMSNGSYETVTDNGLGVLTGSDASPESTVDSTGVIAYDTGIATITWGTLSPDTASEGDASVGYSYYANVFEPVCVVAPSSLTPIAEAVSAELALDSDFLDAIKTQANPIWWVDTSVAAENVGASTVTVTFTQQNVGATTESGRAQRFRLSFFKDAVPTDPITFAANKGMQDASMVFTLTAGTVIQEVTAQEEYIVASESASGTLVVVLEDGADSDYSEFIVLTNEVTGEVHTAECVFAAAP